MAFLKSLEPCPHTLDLSTPPPVAVQLGETLDSSDEEPATPILGASLPVFGLNADPLLRNECAAIRLLNNPRTPSNNDILSLFRRLPRSSLCDRGVCIVGGANPRCSDSILAQCIDTPYFSMLVNRFIRAGRWSPTHPYSTWTLKQGCRDSPHRDNVPYPL